MNFLVILFSFLILLAAGCGFGYLYVRRLYREQKNFERGLKMVPMLIHLPPPSEDTDSKGRDVRDIIDENISKAQILYSILASTFQKGFKNKFYGQRHVALEARVYKYCSGLLIVHGVKHLKQKLRKGARVKVNRTVLNLLRLE
jgi:hypothetical protein